MRLTREMCGRSFAIAMLLLCEAGVAGAQTTPSGQVVAPGVKGQRSAAAPCAVAETAQTVANANDANCVDAPPGFATPALNTNAEPIRNIVAFVRVDSVVPRPPVAMPEGDSFSVVGSATLIKVHRAEVADCLATGKRISARARTSTSTTCLDLKGELVAFQECKTGSADCVVLTPEDIEKQRVEARQQRAAKIQ